MQLESEMADWAGRWGHKPSWRCSSYSFLFIEVGSLYTSGFSFNRTTIEAPFAAIDTNSRRTSLMLPSSSFETGLMRPGLQVRVHVQNLDKH